MHDIDAEAEKAYKKGLEINSRCAECKAGLGKLLLDKGNIAGAQEQFESAMSIDKKNPEIFYMVGHAYLGAAKPDGNKAVQYLDNAKAMNPAQGKYWARLGDAYELLGNHGEAMTSYETAIEKDPKNTAAYVSIAKIWTGAKQYDTAVVYLKKAIELAPNDAQAYKDLIELYIRTNQYDKVTPLLTKYTELMGDDIDAKVRLVKFLTFQAKDYDRAIQLGEELMKSNPEQYTIHRWLAWATFEKGMAKESYDHSKMLFDEISKNPERKAYPSDYDYMAKAAMKMGNIDEAKHIYRKLIELDSTREYDIVSQLAKAYYDAKNYEQAIPQFIRKGEIKPLSATDTYLLGVCYYLTDKDLSADSCFAIYLTAVPTFAQGWLYRARIAEGMDNVEKPAFLPLPYYRKFIETANGDVTRYKAGLTHAYLYMGVYHVQTDSLSLATEEFKKVLEIDSTDEDAIHYLEVLKGRR